MDILFFSLEVVNCEEQGNGSTTRLVTSTVVCGPHFYYKKKNYHLRLKKKNKLKNNATSAVKQTCTQSCERWFRMDL